MKQFTATTYILEKNRVLLIYHKKLNKWLAPGGHVEPNELPCDAAIREAKEETGLDIELILEENIWVKERFNGKSFPRPFMCLLETIPPYKEEPAHHHMDFIYLAKLIEKTNYSPFAQTTQSFLISPNENDKIKWFTLEEIEKMEKDVEIFDETYQVIKYLLTQNRHSPSLAKYVVV